MAKRPRLRTAIRQTIVAFRKHNASRFGAALAFYIVFSIAPALLIAIAVAGHLFGRQNAEAEILDRIGVSIGSTAGIAIAAMIKDTAASQAGWLATTLGLMTMYFGLSGVYRQIDDAIQTIWREKKEDAETGSGLGKRLASMALVLAVGGIVLLSLIADAAIAFAGRSAAARLAGGELLWQASQLLVSTLLLTVMFAAVFRTAAVGSAYGAAGSIVVVLLWSYWSAQIFFLGLEFTHVYAQDRQPE